MSIIQIDLNQPIKAIKPMHAGTHLCHDALGKIPPQ